MFLYNVLRYYTWNYVKCCSRRYLKDMIVVDKVKMAAVLVLSLLEMWDQEGSKSFQ